MRLRVLLSIGLSVGSLAVAGGAWGPRELPPAGPFLEPPRVLSREELDWALRALTVHCRLLVLAAHPDDEDTAALVATVRGQGGEAAYLSLTRGEGGQNRLGLELGEALGLIRTGELLEARRVDGAWQYFARAYDFGYTRSREESLERWSYEELLADAVRVLRIFRPRVLLSVFGDEASSGHGHHQAAGHLAPRAVEAASDPRYRPDLGRVWQVEALYRSGWFEPRLADHEIPLGTIDPWSGYTHSQLALLSRSQHRSQDMGRALELGQWVGRYRRVAGAPAAAGSLCGTEGLELARLAALAPVPERAPLEARLEELAILAAELRRDLERVPEAEALDRAARLLAAWQDLVEQANRLDASLRALLEEKLDWARAVWLGLHRVAVDAWVEQAELVPESTVRLHTVVSNGGPVPLEIESMELRSPAGVQAGGPAGSHRLAPLELLKKEIELSLGREAVPTRPYFLERPREGDRYDWEAAPAEVRGLPDGPAPLRLRVRFRGPGGPVELERAVVARSVDEGMGEIRRAVRILPAVEVALGPGPLLSRGGEPVQLEIRLKSNLERPLVGQLELVSDCPGGSLRTLPVELGSRAEELLRLEVAPCPGRSRQRLHARFRTEGRAFAEAIQAVRGAPRPPNLLPVPAAADAIELDLDWPALGPVAYVPGAADRVPAALARAGLAVEVRTAAELAHLALDRYGAIVVGSRAYEVDADLPRLTPRLLRYVEEGGYLLVQYQQYGYFAGGFAPYRLEVARPHGRITDESSPVRPLEPDDPVFRSPNRLGPEDWEGWIQERALYVPVQWDPTYRPLLELRDPGQEPLQGSILLARHGRGTFVYTGLAFFRQLPAGVPGAFRLFANMLALGGVRENGEAR